MYRYLLAVSLFAASAFGQVQTPRTATTVNGAIASYTVVNSAQSAAVVARGSDPYSNPCGLGGDITTLPYFSLNDNLGYSANIFNDQYGTFEHGISGYTYPQNVVITKLTFKACFVVSGTVTGNSTLYPIIRNKTTGTIYKGNTVLMNANSAPFTSVTVFGSTPVQSATVDWTFATTGAPDINSSDIGNYEIGLAARGRSFPTIKIFGIDTRATFAAYTTPAPSTLLTPSTTYTPNATWNNGSVAVTLTMGDPSSGTGVRLKVKCGDGQYYQHAQLAWGSGVTGTTVVRSAFIYFLNANACSGHALTFGQTTSFSIQPTALNGTPYGNISYSNNVTLN